MGPLTRESSKSSKEKEKADQGRADVEAVVEDLEFTEKGEMGTKRHLVSAMQEVALTAAEPASSL